MGSTSLSSPTLGFLSLPPVTSRRQKLERKVVVASHGTSGGGAYGDGCRLVDENMIVLRIRIREIKSLETNSQSPPSDWMEWEKRYYQHYNQDVCEAVGLLQSFVMNIRPGLALGLLALIISSLPISTAVVILHGIEMAKGILSGVRLS